MSGNCVGFASVTYSDTGAMTLNEGSTQGVPDAAKGAIIVVQGCKVRYRMDGTAPTTETGAEIAVASTLTFDSWTGQGHNWKSCLNAISFKESDSTADGGTLFVHYFD